MTDQSKPRKPKNRKPQTKRRSEGFKQRSNAVNLTAWDPYGNVVSDDVATEIINTVDAIVVKNNLAIDFTRS